MAAGSARTDELERRSSSSSSSGTSSQSTTSFSSSSSSSSAFSFSVESIQLDELNLSELLDGALSRMAALTSGDIVALEKHAHSEPVLALQWVPGREADTPALLSCCADGTLCLWELELAADGVALCHLGEASQRWHHASTPTALVALERSFVVALATGMMFVHSYDSKQTPLACGRRAHLRAPRVLLAVGPHVFSGGDDGLIFKWDPSSGLRVGRLSGHSMNVVALDHDRDRLVSASWDCRVGLWRASTCEPLCMLSGHVDSVKCVAISQNIVVSGSRDTTVRVWSVHGRPSCSHVLRAHTADVLVVRLPLQRKPEIAVSSGLDGLVIIWGLVAGVALQVLDAHEGPVLALSMSTFFGFSGSVDGSVAVISIASGECIRRLEAHADSVRALAYEPRSGVLASGGRDGLLVWWVVDAPRPGEVSLAELRSQMSGMLFGSPTVWDSAASDASLSARNSRNTSCSLGVFGSELRGAISTDIASIPVPVPADADHRVTAAISVRSSHGSISVDSATALPVISQTAASPR